MVYTQNNYKTHTQFLQVCYDKLKEDESLLKHELSSKEQELLALKVALEKERNIAQEEVQQKTASLTGHSFYIFLTCCLKNYKLVSQFFFLNSLFLFCDLLGVTE